MRSLAFIAASLITTAILVLTTLTPGDHAFVRAAVANLGAVGWASFVLPIRGLPRFETWFALKDWERSGRLYRWLGVPWFRRLVRRGPLSVFNRALPAAWHEADPDRIQRETRTSESAHLIAFGIVLALALVAWLMGHRDRAIWLAALDVPTNLYPMLLQRDHRVRLAEHLRRGDLQPHHS